MRVRAAVKTDVGRARERNEDAYLFEEPLFAVADGMGGHRGGDVASSVAIETLRASSATERPAELIDEIKEANRRVLERGEADRRLRGMGTTMTVLIADTTARLAHVGDSRAYLLREGSLQQLTEDHTLVQRWVREGKLSPEQAERHPQRSILTRALGIDDDIPVDDLTLNLRSGDRLLLCTDGLTGMVERDRIQRILESAEDPQQACDELVEAANAAGGDDNITVIVLDVLDDPTADPSSSEQLSAPRAASAAAGPLPDEVASPQPAEVEPGTGGEVYRGRGRRALAWSTAGLVLLVGGSVGAKVYIDRQWYVGDAEGRVAIYNGLPTRVLGFDLSHVRERTDLSTGRAERLEQWAGLEEGITAQSLADARAILDQIRRDLVGQPGAS